MQQTWEEDAAVPRPPQLLAAAQGQGTGQALRTRRDGVAVPSSPPMDIVFPFSPLPFCPFRHTEFILGEFGADGKSQPWELLLFYRSSEAGTVWLTERSHRFP